MPNFDATNLGQGATDSAVTASTAATEAANDTSTITDTTAAATDLRTLINTLCPDGVEWKTLMECSEMQRGTMLTQKDVVAGDVPVISGGVKPAYYHNTPNRTGETVTVASSGASSGYVQYWNQPIYVNDAFSVKGIPNLTDTKFLYYYLKNIQPAICATKIGGGVPHVRIDGIKNFRIPVPPLAVQEKIVQILDKFTELSKELAKEKQARRAQYEYYRDWLLDLAHPEGKQGKMWDLLRTLCPNGVEWKTVREVTDYEQPSKYIVKSTNYDDCFTTPVLTAGKTFILGRTNDTTGIYNATKDNPVILFDDFTGAIQWVDFPFKVKSGAAKMITGKKILTRYLYFYMANLNYTSDEHRRLWISTYSNFRIPVPPLAVQAEIVRILDQFSMLAEDITAGLPAEIAARQTQYEYYRNQLLSFKER